MNVLLIGATGQIGYTLTKALSQTSHQIAVLVRDQANTRLLEFIARLTKRKPMMAQVQLEFLTKGWEPKSNRVQEELGWEPLDLNQGVQKYLRDRANFLA